MSIGAANTFTRNIWKPFIHPAMSPQEEAVLAKLMSLVVKVGALAFILFVPTKFALDLQLLGGMWMAQVFPAVIFGLYTRWFSGWALLAGWATGMVLGTWLAWTPAAWVPVHTHLRFKLCRLQRHHGLHRERIGRRGAFGLAAEHGTRRNTRRRLCRPIRNGGRQISDVSTLSSAPTHRHSA